MATPTRSSCATASHPHNQVHAVERGQADWTADGIPATLLREVTTRFPAQLHRLQAAETDFLRLNTTQAPFNDLRVRQPLNLAIDRAALVRMWGPAVATPTCQVLPSTQLPRLPALLPVHAGAASGRRLDGTHLVRARRLVAASGTQGEQITVWGASDGPIHETTVVPYIVGVLWQLGYHARARLVPSKYLDDHPQLGKTIQLIPTVSQTARRPISSRTPAPHLGGRTTAGSATRSSSARFAQPARSKRETTAPPASSGPGSTANSSTVRPGFPW